MSQPLDAWGPLSEVRESFQLKWYRSPISRQRLRELSRRSDLQGFLQAGGHCGLYLLTGIGVFLSWLHGAWIAFFLALFTHGTVASFFSGIAPHELGHGTVFRTRWLNRFFLYPISLISWFDPFGYNVSHTYHHRYTLHPAGDGEVLLPLHPSVGSTFLLQLFTVNLFTERGRTFGKGGLIPAITATMKLAAGNIDRPDLPSHKWLRALHEDQPEEFRRSVIFARCTLVFHGAIGGLAAITGFWVLPVIFSVAPFAANWLAYFVGMTQHCGLRDNVADFRKCVRSVRLDPVSEFLYWRMNWHTEHHMYAGVPCYHLKALSRELADDMPAPKNLFGAWREMLDTWKRQKLDPEYQYDVPVPESADNESKVGDDLLAESIGDLAPQGLRQS